MIWSLGGGEREFGLNVGNILRMVEGGREGWDLYGSLVTNPYIECIYYPIFIGKYHQMTRSFPWLFIYHFNITIASGLAILCMMGLLISGFESYNYNSLAS